jgi:farnesyl diphosphate synthase
MSIALERSKYTQKVFEHELGITSLYVDKELERLLPKDESNLTKAMRYSCLEVRGKRIRPFLFLEMAKLLSINTSEVMEVAAAIELIHTYSLIHDDLPCMDDDDMRRGKPSCHKAFDEATALLAGDALIPLAFEVISNCESVTKDRRVMLLRELAQAIGPQGMVRGQQLDMEYKGRQVVLEDVINMYKLKTGALMNFSCCAAIMISPNCSQAAKEAIEGFSRSFGIMFQISDNLADGDYQADIREEMHKLMEQYARDALASLKIFDAKADALQALVMFIADCAKS